MNELHLSVAQFNEILNIQLGTLGEFIVEGEVTQMNVSTKGGVNIVLKDPKAQAILNISGFAPRVQGLGMIKVGMQVSVWGSAQIWAAGGRFSLSIYKIIPLGAGALQQAYDQLKQKMTTEGLFAEDRKRPLPDFITKIALVTAKSSAAASDFLKILRENQSGLEVDLYDVQVQGKYAQTEIINTLKYINKFSSKYDLIVLTRGGGSLEDLIAFNDEQLARTIFSLEIPTIVGVGHERDESIADYVADIRASTPSQAAYYLVNQNKNFISQIRQQTEQMHQILIRKINSFQHELDFKVQTLSNNLKRGSILLSAKIERLLLLTNNYIVNFNSLKSDLDFKQKILKSYNPLSILKRGFALISDTKGHFVSSVKDLKVDNMLNLTLKDGKVSTQITKISTKK